MNVLTLWMAIPEATLYMDDGAHNLKLGLPGVKGHGDMCCVCGQCAQGLNHTRYWKPFDITTFQGGPLVPYTPNRVFLSSKDSKKRAVDISSSSCKPPIASDAELSQAALEADFWRRRRNPVRKCRVALKGTIYKDEGGASDSDGGSNEDLPSMPTQGTTPKVTLGSNASSNSSSSSSSSTSSSRSSSGTSTQSMNTSYGEDVASIIDLDEAGWSDLSRAMHMLSQLEEFELQDSWTTTTNLFCCVLEVGPPQGPCRCGVWYPWPHIP